MSAATFAASAALAPASTSAAASLNRISVPRAPLSARFLRPSLLSVSPSRRRSAAATTCSKRSRRAARGIVVSRRAGLFAWPGAGFLALPFPLSGLLALPRCVGLSGRSRAARLGQPGSACFACSLGPSLCTAGGCFRSLPRLFTGTGGSSEGERARPTKMRRDDRLIKGRWQSFGSPSDRLQRLGMPKKNKRVCL